MRRLTDADVAAACIDPRTLTASVASVLADLGSGRASQLPKQTIPTGDGGFFLTVAGAVPALDLAAVKWGSYRPGPAGSAGTSTSAILVTGYDRAENLAFIEGMLATWLRTAAVTAAAATALCPAPPTRLTLLGFGPTNQWSLRYLTEALPSLREIRVAVRSTPPVPAPASPSSSASPSASVPPSASTSSSASPSASVLASPSTPVSASASASVPASVSASPLPSASGSGSGLGERARLARRELPEGCEISFTTDVAAAVRGADLAVSATGARAALADLGALAEGGVAVSLDGSLTWRTGEKDLVLTDRSGDFGGDRDAMAVFTPGRREPWFAGRDGRRVLADLAGSAVTDVALAAVLLGITRQEVTP